MTAKEKNDGVILNTTASDLLARAPIHVPRLASTGARAPSADATDARRPTGAQRQCFGSARRTRIAVSRRRARATACVVCSVVATLMPCTVAVVTGFLPSGTYGPKRRIDGTPVSTRRAPKHVLFAAAPSFVWRRHAHRLQLRPTPPSCSLIRSSASTLVCDFGGAAVCSFTSRVVSRASVCTVLQARSTSRRSRR